jgi:hypothetical protein
VESEIRYNILKKMLQANIEDPAWRTVFQPMLVSELLTNIYTVVNPEKNVKFEYYSMGKGEWGFRAIPKKDKLV